MSLGKRKFVLPIFLCALSTVSFISQSYAGLNNAEVRHKFAQNYRNAEDKSAFLVKSAKEALRNDGSEADIVIAETIINTMKQDSMGKKHPEYLTAVKELEHHKDLRIAQQAKVIHQKMEDRFEYLDLNEEMKRAPDKKTILRKYANSESDWARFWYWRGSLAIMTTRRASLF